MAIDWNREVLAPVMSLFGEGDAADPSSWPIYSPAGGAPFALAGAVFDAQYQHTTINDQDEQSTIVRPLLGVRTSQFAQRGLSGPRQNDNVFIPSIGKAYGVADVQPDGHGHAKLYLIEVTL